MSPCLVCSHTLPGGQCYASHGGRLRAFCKLHRTGRPGMPSCSAMPQHDGGSAAPHLAHACSALSLRIADVLAQVVQIEHLRECTGHLQGKARQLKLGKHLLWEEQCCICQTQAAAFHQAG